MVAFLVVGTTIGLIWADTSNAAGDRRRDQHHRRRRTRAPPDRTCSRHPRSAAKSKGLMCNPERVGRLRCAKRSASELAGARASSSSASSAGWTTARRGSGGRSRAYGSRACVRASEMAARHRSRSKRVTGDEAARLPRHLRIRVHVDADSPLPFGYFLTRLHLGRRTSRSPGRARLYAPAGFPHREIESRTQQARSGAPADGVAGHPAPERPTD
jgi:hypothetical protein